MSRYRIDGYTFNFPGDSMNRSQLEQFEEDWRRIRRLLEADGPAPAVVLEKRARRLAARGFLTIQTYQGEIAGLHGLEVMAITDKGRKAASQS